MNWRDIVRDHSDLIGRQFARDGNAYTFFGIVWGDNDFYYGMWRDGDLQLLSCVGSIDAHGYELVAEF